MSQASADGGINWLAIIRGGQGENVWNLLNTALCEDCLKLLKSQ